MTAAAVDTVLFDADGVMQRVADGWRDRLAALCPHGDRVDVFLAELFEAERPCLVGAAEFDARLASVLQRWRVRKPLEEVLRIWELIEPCRELFHISDGLRRAGILVGLATNQQARRARYMADRLGYRQRFDALFFSHEIGHAKPAPEFFEHVIEVLGRLPARLLLIDDNPRNVAAAREAGLRAEVYDLETGVPGMLELLARHGLDGGGRGTRVDGDRQ